MNRHLLSLFAALGLSTVAAFASGHWTLQSKDYMVDTVFHAKIGPGTTQTSLSLSGGSNLKIFYVTIDLDNPYVDVRVAQAGSKLTGGAKLSGMSSANSNASTGIEYFAGVNADFFGNSQPIGGSVVNGDAYKAPGSTDWISWYMNDQKVPGIEHLNFKGTATSPAGNHAVSGINVGRGENNLIIFNSHFGANTGTNAYGTEVVVTCDKKIGFNGTYTCTVMGTPTGGVGSMSIPEGQYVLSGHGTASTFVSNLKSGDVVTLDLNTPIATGGTITQLAGGQPIILQNGETLETQNALDHLTALNPRTAVGYSADRKTLVLLVVDGRSMGGSAGVVSKVLADIMRCVGCSDAMNFDGGGSSELYTTKFGVRNKPSDGSERTVVNSVWAVATAPADNEIGEIAFQTPYISLPKYSYYTPSFYTYNKCGVMLSTDFKGATLSCPAELGEVVNGTTLYITGSGTHKLTATYNGVTADVFVTVGSGEPRARLDKVIVDGFRPYPVEVVATVGNEDMPVDNKAFTWSIDNTDIAEIDDMGVVNGKSTGTATVTAKVENHTFTLPVDVQKPATHYVDIINSNATDWTTSKVGLSQADITVTGNGLAVDYKISSTRSITLSMKAPQNTVLYSLPDSVRIVMNPGSGKVTKVELSLKPNNGSVVKVSKDVSLTANANNVLTFATSEFCDEKDFASYPLTLNQIYLTLGGATGDEVHLEIPVLTSVYNAVSGSDGVEDVTADKHESKVLCANVVRRGELIELTERCNWSVYNLAGAIVSSGKGEYIDSGLFGVGQYVVVTDAGSERLIVR